MGQKETWRLNRLKASLGAQAVALLRTINREFRR
jgi:hypothetical protein